MLLMIDDLMVLKSVTLLDYDCDTIKINLITQIKIAK
jgi:hypothetical protein